MVSISGSSRRRAFRISRRRTASSAITTFGLSASARAMAIRCRCPPENSCLAGEWFKLCALTSRRTYPHGHRACALRCRLAVDEAKAAAAGSGLAAAPNCFRFCREKAPPSKGRGQIGGRLLIPPGRRFLTITVRLPPGYWSGGKIGYQRGGNNLYAGIRAFIPA